MSTQPQYTANSTSNSTSDEEEDIYDTYPDFTQIAWVRTTYVLAYVLVMGLAVSGNALVCWTVASRRRMRTAVNLYIANLAACDLAVGAFVAPVKLAELAAPASWGLLSDGVCTAAVYLQTCVVFASVLTLVAICIERWVAFFL
ncbi:hypothetical protein JTE90_004418 [Oedothorax gibbosus]|uniref:G-protein coupled receptors family 1 profile domain-containing protein n=1 Tax=Oedothorax gibbosus TaxID=931172 RepID=A0AAV6UQG0_9ARAC|nr:hypothetical protein JTE90_004418 [Oedothorax gibbosus]